MFLNCDLSLIPLISTEVGDKELCKQIFRITEWQNGRSSNTQDLRVHLLTEQKIMKSFSLLTVKNNCLTDVYKNAWASRSGVSNPGI